MNVENVSDFDEKLLTEVLKTEGFEWISNYNINIKMFYKTGIYDKEGNIKRYGIMKNGSPVPMAIKIVSSFNRLTDTTDVKIQISKELWQEMSEIEKKATLEHYINFLELKVDKIGEPICISDTCDKVQLKLKYPDFYSEGFISLAKKYGDKYFPIQDSNSFVALVETKSENTQAEVKNKETPKAEIEQKKPKKKKEPEVEETISQEDFENLIDNVNL